MKKIRTIALLGILLASSLHFSSCKKDEEPAQITEQVSESEEFDFSIFWTQNLDGTYEGHSPHLDDHIKPTDSYENISFIVKDYSNLSLGQIPGRMYFWGDPYYGHYGWYFDYEIDNGSVVFKATCFGETEDVTYGGNTYRAPQEWPHQPTRLIFKTKIIRVR